ncbi:MAG: hypothetical protein IJ876_02820 [Elusimicrobiaceae bacterium]|nr:hypothetical protein [Elusimicrobiaceae bacterium]
MLNIARLVFPGFWFGKTPEEEALTLARAGVGGFCLYGGTKTKVATLTRKLRAASPLPRILIAADYEDGLGKWLPDAELLPSNLALGAAGEEQLAFEKGFITAREALSIGVDWVFAPVVDLADNAGNPIVNTRSFGADPKQVARLAGAFMKGLARGGALNCLKHFPGHGNTTTDSHIDMPVVTETTTQLKKVTLLPFQELLPLADSVMVGHLLVPALDDQNPASLSPIVIHKLLEKLMGFTRCVCTDALLMKALGDEKQAALQALDAGAHVLLVPEKPMELIEFLKAQVFPDEVLKQAERVLNELCAQADELAATAQKESVQPADFAMRTARKALVPLGHFPPVEPGDTVHLLNVGNDENFSAVPFIDTLRAYGIITEDFKDPAQTDTLIILFWRRYKPFSGKIGLTEEETAFVNKAVQHVRRTLLICFANPWAANHVNTEGKLLAFSPSPVFQQAAAECVMGMFEPIGKLPMNL